MTVGGVCHQQGVCEQEGQAAMPRLMPPLPPPTQPHLKAVDIQDGNGQSVLPWGNQRIDPRNQPAEQQCIQDLGDGIPGGERQCWGGWGTRMGCWDLGAEAWREAASPGIHSALHSQGCEDLLSHCLLGGDMVFEWQQAGHCLQEAPRGLEVKGHRKAAGEMV